MRHPLLVLSLVFFILAEPVWAAADEAKSVNWAQLREEVATRRLNNRSVTIRVSDGKTVSSTLRRIEADGLVVASNPNTEKRWRATGLETKIPRAEVNSIKFAGRQGHRGLIGGLAGLGASGAIIGGAVAATPPGEGQGGEGMFALIPVMGLAGYFIGRHYDKRIPQYRIVP